MPGSARIVLIQGLAVVAERMEPREAARLSGQIASILIQELRKEKNAYTLDTLAQGLVAVAERMEPRETARVCGQTANILTEALKKEEDANAINMLVQRLAALAGKMSREEAAAVCRPAVQTLLQAFETGKVESDRLTLAMAMATLLSASDVTDASRISKRMAFTVCSGREAVFNRPPGMARGPMGGMPGGGMLGMMGGMMPGGGRGAGMMAGEIGSLEALLTSNSHSEVRRRTVEAATIVGLVSATPFPALPLLPAVSEPLPCRLSTQDLIDLLKMPTCFGEARKVLVRHLGNRYGRTYANHWEFVHFAQEQHLGLDLTSPPKRWGGRR